MAKHYSEQELLHLYEGDQSTLYSGALAHHHDINDPESKAKVRKIWRVTLLLTIVTIFEVAVGLWLFKISPDVSKVAVHIGIICYFVVLTMIKAYYIVKVFMHLGDETRMFGKFVLTPMILIVWLAVVLLTDATFHLGINETFAHTVESILGNHKP